MVFKSNEVEFANLPSLKKLLMSLQNPFYLNFFPKKIRQQLEGRHNLFAVLHNSGWLMADKVFKAMVTLIVGAWVARYLGPTEYGKLAYILAIVAFFQVVSTLGLDGIVVRDIAKNKDEAGVILGTTFMMRLIVGMICWLGLVVFMVLIYGWGNENMWLALFIGGSLLFQAADTIDLWFQSQTQSRRTVLAKFIAILISSSLRVVFITLKAPLVYFAVAFLVEFSIAALALYFSYQRFRCEQKWVVQVNERGRKLLKESWPFILSSVSVMVYMRIDQVMIRNILGEMELGIYSAVIALSTGWYIIANTVYSSILPSLTRVKEQNEQLFLQRLVTMFRLLILVSVTLTLLTVWQGENLIQLIYGTKYISGSTALSIHVFTNISVFLGVGQGVWIINYRKSKLFLIQTLVGGAVSIVLNTIFIPLFGISGAALSATLSFLSSAILTNFFIERDLFKLQIGLIK
ncbi:MAG: flippase [Cyclobacteriaceae bacterium]|nr:flippase [Cyclobacteriaceae bacterium]